MEEMIRQKAVRMKDWTSKRRCKWW